MPTMIRLCRPGRGPIYLAPDAIAVIRPGSASDAWHCVQARVQLHDGRCYKVRQTAEAILTLMAEATSSRGRAGATRRAPDGLLRLDG